MKNIKTPIYVIKRTGDKELFDTDRIFNVIAVAYSKLNKSNELKDVISKEGILLKIQNEDLLNMDEIELIKNITKEVINNLPIKESITVNEIQNVVRHTLIDMQIYDIAEEYIYTSKKRDDERVISSNFIQDIEDIVRVRNIENSNANVDERSFGGRKFRASGELHKFIALNKMISSKIRIAFIDNKLYIHDLDSYDIGQHNCTLLDLNDILSRGFKTRNGGVRKPSTITTAYQLVAVIFQIQSQVQYGGVGSPSFDSELAPYVAKSFVKQFNKELKTYNRYNKTELSFDDKFKVLNKKDSWKLAPNLLEVYEYIHENAKEALIEEMKQASEGLVHNLNTLESRPGSQLPFTSVNIGYDTSEEARMVSKYLLEALLEGIGENHKTSIFPIVIFKHKKGINAYEGEPNYDLKQLAIKCLSKRIYPNFVNCDVTYFENDGTSLGTMATMGCRTLMSTDRHAPKGCTDRSGRGNLAPSTIILPELGIKYGICKGEREQADLEGFWNEFTELVETVKDHLLERFEVMCNQSLSSAPFMYGNRTWKGTDEEYAECERTGSLYPLLRHGSLAIGYLGISEMCQALFGKTHDEDDDVYEFALKVVNYIADKAEEYSETYDLNFGCYATPKLLGL